MAHGSDITPHQQSALRAWLRLLNGSNQIRKTLQARLQAAHGMSLSRFDVLANLYRAPEGGVRLSDLSKQLMVSNGNVTQVMAPLMKEGLVERQASPEDGRVATAKLTAVGRTLFEAMAADHALWVEELFDTLDTDEQQMLVRLLEKLEGAAG
ncbi:MarR family winged helix-turn-helix transcriptional regulator [Kordiimonas marina]|uniref:MarR family winged helix-turn-helix transcriptional regulator n=1 Tax=Kordiimonas marina TaxID=2872312 RepID=UPI001FF5CD05|nr:MarR family transcriptional regulator [Kordiimonas marina]MCJ9429957.1 MarR family transcriptional regulator [Kordiimonas marina]